MLAAVFYYLYLNITFEIMDWISLTSGLLGGGIIVYIFDLIKNRGKIELNQTTIKIFYREVYRNIYIMKFSVDLQFINTSGYQKIIKGIMFRYFDGNEYYNLSIDGYNVKPAGIIPQKDVKCLQFIGIPPNKQIESSIPLNAEKVFIEVSYILNGETRKIFINANEIELQDITKKLDWA